MNEYRVTYRDEAVELIAADRYATGELWVGFYRKDDDQPVALVAAAEVRSVVLKEEADPA